MVILFAFEFIEGNTVTRLYFMRLRRLTGEGTQAGHFTPGTGKGAGEHVPTLHALPRFADAISHRRARDHQAGDVDDVYRGVGGFGTAGHNANFLCV